MTTAASCLNLGESDESADARFYGFFLRDVKTMEELGLPVYWLGREFTAGGLAFQGPYGAEFGGEVEGGGIFLHYTSWLDGTPFEGSNIWLDITVYGPAAWEPVKDRILNPRVLSTEGEVTRRTVTVKGHQAEMISVPFGSRPVNRMTLIIELDSVVVVGAAASNLSPDGTELSIFVKDPDLFVQVMQDLRPYPE
jgi:hypothetical protein